MIAIPRRGLCLVLSAPSGAGKSAIAAALVASEPALRLSVSATTREPRAGEADGVHYYFHTQASFDALVAANGFLEWARVLGRNRYGTPRAPVEAALAAGLDMAFDIDWQGHRQLRAALPADVVAYSSCRPAWRRWSPACAAAPAMMPRKSRGGCSSPRMKSATGRSSTTWW